MLAREETKRPHVNLNELDGSTVQMREIVHR